MDPRYLAFGGVSQPKSKAAGTATGQAPGSKSRVSASAGPSGQSAYGSYSSPSEAPSRSASKTTSKTASKSTSKSAYSTASKSAYSTGSKSAYSTGSKSAYGTASKGLSSSTLKGTFRSLSRGMTYGGSGSQSYGGSRGASSYDVPGGSRRQLTIPASTRSKAKDRTDLIPIHELNLMVMQWGIDAARNYMIKADKVDWEGMANVLNHHTMGDFTPAEVKAAFCSAKGQKDRDDAVQYTTKFLDRWREQPVALCFEFRPWHMLDQTCFEGNFAMRWATWGDSLHLKSIPAARGVTSVTTYDHDY